MIHKRFLKNCTRIRVKITMTTAQTQRRKNGICLCNWCVSDYFTIVIILINLLAKSHRNCADVIGFWQHKLDGEMRHLAKYCVALHSTPSTSACVERLFSKCVDVKGVRRHSLDPISLEREVMLCYNVDFI